MFESAVIRRHANGEQIVDAGVIAETLLFYSNVHIIADQGILVHLLQAVGAENLLQLIEQKITTFTFLRNVFGTHTETTNDIALNRFVSIRVVADAKGRKYSNVGWVVSRSWEWHRRAASRSARMSLTCH